jgi:hypothetical protein
MQFWGQNAEILELNLLVRMETSTIWKCKMRFNGYQIIYFLL